MFPGTKEVKLRLSEKILVTTTDLELWLRILTFMIADEPVWIASNLNSRGSTVIVWPGFPAGLLWAGEFLGCDHTGTKDSVARINNTSKLPIDLR